MQDEAPFTSRQPVLPESLLGGGTVRHSVQDGTPRRAGLPTEVQMELGSAEGGDDLIDAFVFPRQRGDKPGSRDMSSPAPCSCRSRGLRCSC